MGEEWGVELRSGGGVGEGVGGVGERVRDGFR